MLAPLLTTTDKENYDAYLEQKVSRVHGLIRERLLSEEHGPDSGIDSVRFEVHPSLPEHYRMRAEFAIFHNADDTFDYVMFEKRGKERRRIIIRDFPGCTVAINRAMSLLRKIIVSDAFRELRFKLFEADFLCNQQGDVVISLIYHKKIDEALWQEQAAELRRLMSLEGLECSVLGHARKQFLICGREYVTERFETSRGEVLLKQVEGTFSQPNATACLAMLNFAISCAPEDRSGDLIELYCGSGTFTVTLAPLFRKAFATELARLPTQTAIENMRLNRIDNLKIARMSAVEVTQALKGEKEFNRLKEADVTLSDYDFTTLLIDPPRAGLQDEAALNFTASFDRIIYISCGPESLAADLAVLTRTHKITRLAFFDQFPYTNHLESGVLLERRR